MTLTLDLFWKDLFLTIIPAVCRGRWHGDVMIHTYTDRTEGEVTEFLGEVSRMSILRHENIALFMGACLEEPNLAVVTRWESSYVWLTLTQILIPVFSSNPVTWREPRCMSRYTWLTIGWACTVEWTSSDRWPKEWGTCMPRDSFFASSTPRMSTWSPKSRYAWLITEWWRPNMTGELRNGWHVQPDQWSRNLCWFQTRLWLCFSWGSYLCCPRITSKSPHSWLQDRAKCCFHKGNRCVCFWVSLTPRSKVILASSNKLNVKCLWLQNCVVWGAQRSLSHGNHSPGVFALASGMWQETGLAWAPL